MPHPHGKMAPSCNYSTLNPFPFRSPHHFIPTPLTASGIFDASRSTQEQPNRLKQAPFTHLATCLIPVCRTNRNNLSAAAFMALGIPACTVAIALLCLLMLTGHGGIFKSFMESHFMAVISRLTYCLYLVHPAILTIVESKPAHLYSDSGAAFLVVGVTASSLIFATVLHLSVSEGWIDGLTGLVESRRDPAFGWQQQREGPEPNHPLPYRC